MRVVFISHEADAPPGHLGDAARTRRLRVEVCRVWAGDRLPRPDPQTVLVPLGSARAAYDDTVPWLAAELALLREAVEAGAAVLGVCFGAQALARALGGRVRPAERPEIGWHAIDPVPSSGIAAGPWFEWHFDTMTPPPGAEVLATSAVGVQTFQVGRSLGVQFHPEVTPSIVGDWVASAADEVRGARVDPGRLVAETRRQAPRARRAAFRLFDRVLERLAITPPR